MAEMSPLRRRMIEDMTVRNLSPATQRSYVHALAPWLDCGNVQLSNAFSPSGAMAMEADRVRQLDSAFEKIGRYDFKWPY